MAERRILHYRILQRLGAGGMGEVLLAEDERLGRQVALKFLPPGGLTAPDRAERLAREARSLASLNHPGIAAIHALEVSEGRPFLAMEYVEGETLAERIARRPLPLEDAIRVGREVAEALEHAHARGVIHRDVKPANILVTQDGATKLADFGLALLRDETRLTAEGTVSGTAHYMSPEQARGAEVDGRSDLFSLGAVLYEALTGKRPFDAAGPDAVLHAIQSREPELPTALRSGVPLELERIVLKCLRKSPALRYQHAADLAADLKALESGVSATRTIPVGAAGEASGGGPPAPRSGAPARAGTRRRLSALVAAVGVVAAAAAAIYLTGVARRAFAPRSGTAEASPRGIAVLSFENLADPADSSRAAVIAASLLTVGLGQAQGVPVVGAQRVRDVMRAMGLTRRSIGRAEALEVGRRAAATEPDVVLAAEVASTRDGSLLTAGRVRAQGGPRGLFNAVDSLTTALQDGFRQAGIAVSRRAMDVAGLTTRNPAAYRAYVRGMEELGQMRLPEAGEAFRSAIAADSLFALARYYAAVAAWWATDFEAAQSEVTRALALGTSLSGREREGLRGLEALIRYDFDRAADLYRDLLTRYPDDVEFLYGLGEAAFHSEKYDEAAPVLERAVALDPAFGVAYYHLVDIDVERKDLAAALKRVAAFSKIDPASPENPRLEASARARLGDLDGALSALGRVLERDPKDRKALYHLSVTHAWRGEFKQAERFAARLRSAAPEETPGDAVQAGLVLLWAKGRPAEMERVAAARIAAADPAATRYRISLSLGRLWALDALGRNAEALKLARRVRDQIERLVPWRNTGVSLIVDPMLRLGRIGDAEELLDQYRVQLESGATSRERENRDYCAGLIALARGKPREATRLLEHGLPYGPPGGRVWLHNLALARARLAAGDRDRAIAVLREMALSDEYSVLPMDVFGARLLLAHALEETGERTEALALYRRVERQYREAEPGLPALKEARAGVRRLGGSPAGAS
jgi:tetratricopeptide (TPR) repeat protein